MPEVTVRQMEYLVAVIDEGSVAGGAQVCHVSPASLSASLSKLERVLGADLLLRGPARRAVPTPAGEMFARRARDILAAIAEAVGELDESRDVLRGRLRVGCTVTASPRFIPGLIAHTQQHWPDIELQLVEDQSWALQDLVATGKLDLAIVYRHQIKRSDLDEHVLIPVRLHALLPAESPLAGASEVSMADLQDLPVMMLDAPPVEQVLAERVRRWGYRLDVRRRSASPETIRSLVALGLGYSLVNAVPHGSSRSFEGGRVVYRPVAEDAFDNAAVAVTAAGRHRARRVAAAVATLRAVAARSDPARWWDHDGQPSA